MKNEPAPMQSFKGRTAAPGLARGPLVFIAERAAAHRAAGDPAQEAAGLRNAMAQAGATLKALIDRSTLEAGAILEFQLAMLEDATLSEGAFDAIAAGIPADHAWRAALESEIAGYQAEENEFFRARAADLLDLQERVLAGLSGAVQEAAPAGAILVADDFTPSRFLAQDWAGGGLVLRQGSATSHVAMLARSRGVPMLVGAAVPADPALAGAPAALDAGRGLLAANPDAAFLNGFAAAAAAALHQASVVQGHARRPGRSRDGFPVAVHLNIADVGELTDLDPAICDGIGLVRTELLFEGGALPDEERQYRAYRQIAEWAQGRPVVIRTLDAGGDKPIAGLTPEGESNPFLGVRGVRLTLRRPEIFKVQLRALARAAAHGDVRIMVPMVAVPRELTESRALLAEAVTELAREGAAHRRPPLGMMVEVPAAAIAMARFDADFYSIGSNDLTQYVMAAGRDIAAVADLADAGDPAVLALIAQVVAEGARQNRPVSLCGDAAGDPALLAKLLQAGLRSLSVAPRLAGAVKAALAGLDIGGG